MYVNSKRATVKLICQNHIFGLGLATGYHVTKKNWFQLQTGIPGFSQCFETKFIVDTKKCVVNPIIFDCHWGLTH